MNKKMKLRYRAVLSLILSAVLFCMPVMAFSMNGNNAVSVRAEDAGTEEETESMTEESGTDQETPEQETENGSEESGGGTVSGNDVPEPVCTCGKKCSAYDYDRDCEVCAADYKNCEYQTPNVVIGINSPAGWYNEKAAVTFSVSDAAHTGNFEVAMIQAKVGQNGSWTDVTEDKKLEISENCTVYVQVTDQKGNTYERSRAIRCFDTTKPTLNAAVSDGLLSVQVHDTDSGAKAVYVNGYEFTELTNGTLNIRLQQFDAGYEYFTISAMDNAGNMSEVYKTKNPYYKDPADESDENPAEQLPVNAEATKPGNATGTVTEHTKTDSDGNTVSENSLAEQKKQAMAEADAAEAAESGEQEKEQSGQGKEFYTIQTASDKVFYLIIDRDGEEEMVYFLTEITENDLLNTTSDNSETLPKNSAALESAIPTEESALPNNNGEALEDTEQAEDTEETEDTEDAESTEETEPEEKAEEPNPVISYILMGALAIAFIGGAYYFKVVRKKKEDFIEDEDEDEEDEEEYEDEEDEEDGSGDDFFADDDREADAAETIAEADPDEE
ncbi:MAG: CD1107 family mobile element protein [Acetatifactor sp.]